MPFAAMRHRHARRPGCRDRCTRKALRHRAHDTADHSASTETTAPSNRLTSQHEFADTDNTARTGKKRLEYPVILCRRNHGLITERSGLCQQVCRRSALSWRDRRGDGDGDRWFRSDASSASCASGAGAPAAARLWRRSAIACFGISGSPAATRGVKSTSRSGGNDVGDDLVRRVAAREAGVCRHAANSPVGVAGALPVGVAAAVVGAAAARVVSIPAVLSRLPPQPQRRPEE